MKSSNSIAEIAKALCLVQARVEDSTKNATNPHLKNNYANLQSVLETVRPILTSVGLSFTQLPGYGDGVVYLETVLMHNSGEYLTSSCSAPLTKMDAQGVGSTLTYLRRYSLAALVGITQADEDGQSVALQSSDRLCTFAQADRLQRLLNKCPEATVLWFEEKYGTPQGVLKSEFDRLFAGIKAKLEVKEDASN